MILVSAVVLAASSARGQGLSSRPDAPAGARGASAAVATRALVPPVIDGRDDDAIWQTAPMITAFRQNQPVENGVPSFTTTARIAYDAQNLYVFLRAYDPHPDSIHAPLARRDATTIASDWMGILVDGYHDRRTGYELDVNPAGVKQDWSIQNDGDEDLAWDGVWEVATRVDSLGWTAEFRIPLSQLRYATAPTDTFGIYLWRRVDRLGENDSWPAHRTTVPGLVSQFGDLTDLRGLAPPARSEIAPYMVTRYRSGVGGGTSGAGWSGGADVKLAPASNLTLNATINPDFGQVEADPAQLNLTAFETFFPEQRPFFVQGASAFNVPLNCGVYSCYSENLFYSRRIGRAPQLAGTYGVGDGPAATPILGAGKLTGRVGGTTFGLLGALTERVAGPAGVTLEPAAQYTAMRVSQDFRNGQSGVGVAFTGVHRDLDAGSAPFLHRDAFAAGVDFRHLFLGQYLIHGTAHWSDVTGTAQAIAATQRDPVHNYERPDGSVHVDTTRTALQGDDEELALDKTAGVVQGELIYTRRSPGFDVNDVGYLRQADQQTAYAWVGLNYTQPTTLYRTLTWNFNSWYWASAAGLPTDRAVNTNVHLTTHGLWRLGAWVSIDGLGATFCDRCARGGPALRQDRSVSTWFDVTGDSRRTLSPELTLTTACTDGGRSMSTAITPTVSLNTSGRFSGSLSLNVVLNRNNTQWLGNPVDSSGTTHYTFARLDQRTVGVTARANYTIATTLSIQAYLQPFVSWGPYGDVREFADPRAAAYADRFRPYTGSGAPTGLYDRELKADVVVRWEYHPGSALFVVWSQGRGQLDPTSATRGYVGNLRDVFNLPGDNTFLMKLSYWFTR